MSAFIQCPSCKENIDDNSFYCDQCGMQIFVCSVCARPGKGKKCTFDGRDMIPKGSSPPAPASQTGPASASQTNPDPDSSATGSTAAQANAGTPVSTASANDKIKLTAQSHGIVLEASSGDIIGRTKGNFTGLLGQFSHISGQHCQIANSNGEWNLSDLGSTNGTFYNGAKLSPNIPCRLNNSGRLKIADIEFVISFSANDGGTTRI